MAGIEILASEEVAVAQTSWNWAGFWIAVGIVFITAVVAGIIEGKKEGWGYGFALFLIVFIIAGAYLGVVAGRNTGKPTEYTTHYKATIDDSVSLTEFMDKYEIIAQDGKIYTIKEKGE